MSPRRLMSLFRVDITLGDISVDQFPVFRYEIKPAFISGLVIEAGIPFSLQDSLFHAFIIDFCVFVDSKSLGLMGHSDSRN